MEVVRASVNQITVRIAGDGLDRPRQRRPGHERCRRECENVSKKYLDRILGSLRAAGLLESHRGKGGGYVLARPPAGITARDVVSVLETGNALVPCVADPDVCAKSFDCSTRNLWERLSSAIDSTLGDVTLADLARGDD